MAVLYITEYAKLGVIFGKTSAIALAPPIASQTVAIGGSTTPSAAVNTATRYVRLHTDAICSVTFGTAPTAASTDMRMAAGQTEYFAVSPGTKVAVITNT